MTCANCERRKALRKSQDRRRYLKHGDRIRAKNLKRYHERKAGEQREGS